MTNSLAPLRKRVDVPLSPDAAFDLFTRDIARWWPTDAHSLSAYQEATPADVQVEPFVGGRILETLADGRTAPWATVTDWAPGRRFAAQWYVGRSEDEATDLTVVFSPVEGGTTVELTHGGFDRLAATEGETMCKSYDTGWDHVCGCYAKACRNTLVA